MKRYATGQIRNVALVGHGGAGKTSLAEALLHRAGAITRMGRVEDGTTVCDYDPEEHKRGISLSLSVAPVEWRDHNFTLQEIREYRRRIGGEQFLFADYVLLARPVGGEDVRRSYSICAPAGGPLRIAVKRSPGVVFSTWANDALREGRSLDVMPPMGHFNVAADAQAARHYLGVAAGSGITPVLSIVATALAAEPRSRFTLIYGNRASATVMFRDELAALKDLYFRRKVRHKNVILLEVFSERLSVKFHQRLPFVVRHVSGIERRFVTDETQPWFVLGLRLAVFVKQIGRVSHSHKGRKRIEKIGEHDRNDRRQKRQF